LLLFLATCTVLCDGTVFSLLQPDEDVLLFFSWLSICDAETDAEADAAPADSRCEATNVVIAVEAALELALPLALAALVAPREK